MLHRRIFLFQLGGCVIASSGCGTVLHHERIGRPHSNEVDWEIAALNGLGLALFFVPGVVAFAVDFYNGTIYLPQESTHLASQKVSRSAPQIAIDSARELAAGAAEGSIATLRRLFLQGRERFSPQAIEAQVNEETGQQISLLDHNTRVSQLTDLNRLAEQCQRHRQNPQYGIPSTEFFAYRKGGSAPADLT